MTIMDKKILTTAELVVFLKQNADRETECRLILAHGVGSTHYWYWDSAKKCFMHTRDWPFSPYSQKDVLEYFSDCKWILDQ